MSNFQCVVPTCRRHTERIAHVCTEHGGHDDALKVQLENANSDWNLAISEIKSARARIQELEAQVETLKKDKKAFRLAYEGCAEGQKKLHLRIHRLDKQLKASAPRTRARGAG